MALNNSTKTDVVNDALLIIGEATVLTSTEKSARAKTMDRIFDQVKRFVFRMQPWSCLIDRIILSAESEAPAFGFDYKIQIPGDCIRVVEVSDNVVYKREGKYLLTNSPTLGIVYVKDVTNYSTLDSHLYSLLVNCLAYYAAVPITGKKWIMNEMKSRYVESVGEALASDSFESTPDAIEGVDDYNIFKMFGGQVDYTTPIEIEEGT